MRYLFMIPAIVAFFMARCHDNARYSLGSSGSLRVVRLWSEEMMPLLITLLVATWLVIHRPGRLWAWPLMLAAWLVWAAMGRVVTIDLMTGEIRGYWWFRSTDDHPHPPTVDSATYLCNASISMRGWWLDIVYEGVKDPVYLGPFIAGRTHAEFGTVLAPCK